MQELVVVPLVEVASWCLKIKLLHISVHPNFVSEMKLFSLVKLIC